jgi:hypothetical protein
VARSEGDKAASGIYFFSNSLHFITFHYGDFVVNRSKKTETPAENMPRPRGRYEAKANARKGHGEASTSQGFFKTSLLTMSFLTNPFLYSS